MDQIELMPGASLMSHISPGAAGLSAVRQNPNLPLLHDRLLSTSLPDTKYPFESRTPVQYLRLEIARCDWLGLRVLWPGGTEGRARFALLAECGRSISVRPPPTAHPPAPLCLPQFGSSGLVRTGREQLWPRPHPPVHTFPQRCELVPTPAGSGVRGARPGQSPASKTKQGSAPGMGQGCR